MPNPENLKPIKKGQLSREELKKRQSNGGKKSVQVRREKKLMRQVAEEKLLKLLPCGKTFQEAALDELEKLVLTGITPPKDLIAILEFLRDTAGQKPTDKVEAKNTNVTITDTEIIDKVTEKLKKL